MQIRDINKPVNSKTLNETMAKKYGTKINVDSFTLEQLQDARNKLRTKLSDIETNESFSGLSQNKTYSKNKLFLDVLNAAISERSNIDEGELPPALKAYQDKKAGKEPADKEDKEKKPKDGKMPMDDNGTPDDKSDDKPAFLKKKKNEAVVKEGKMKAVCKDCGDTFGKPTTDCKNDCNDPTQDCWVKESVEEGIKLVNPKSGKKIDITKPEGNAEYKKAKAAGDFDDEDLGKKVKETRMVDEGKAIIESYFKSLVEGEEDKAEIVMAAKDMVDRLTGWMEDTAEMQSESMLELADAIRDEMGAAQSESFTNTVKPALESLYTAMEGTRVALTQGVGMLTGEAEPMDAMGDEPALDAEEPGMEPTVDAEEPAMDDGMGAAAPAAGGEDEAGRAKRESIQRSRRLGTILSSRN
ncbi:hypothetical protein N9I97_00140 [bacterium]|nr:hypothetical protein [bacterium]